MTIGFDIGRNRLTRSMKSPSRFRDALKFSIEKLFFLNFGTFQKISEIIQGEVTRIVTACYSSQFGEVIKKCDVFWCFSMHPSE